MHLPYALSVYTTCVYRQIQHEQRLSPEKVEIFLAEFQKVLNM